MIQDFALISKVILIYVLLDVNCSVLLEDYLLFQWFTFKLSQLLNLCEVPPNEIDVMHLQLSSYKKRKRMEKHAYEEWKSSVVASNNQNKGKGSKNIFLSKSNSFSPNQECHPL